MISNSLLSSAWEICLGGLPGRPASEFCLGGLHSAAPEAPPKTAGGSGDAARNLAAGCSGLASPRLRNLRLSLEVPPEQPSADLPDGTPRQTSQADLQGTTQRGIRNHYKTVGKHRNSLKTIRCKTIRKSLISVRQKEKLPISGWKR